MIQPPVFIDPPSEAFYEGRFFADSVLNRDECLRPYIRLKEVLASFSMPLDTFDRLGEGDFGVAPIDYYSFGILKNIERLSKHNNVRMKGFFLFEPPVVSPEMYAALPAISNAFENVYVHNTHGDGYSLAGVDKTKLRKLYWPQPFSTVLDQYWENQERLSKMVVINGNHKPTSYHGELYSKRIEAIAELSKSDYVDLYGRGWERWWSRSSMWMPYWKNIKSLMKVYRGSCNSKFDVLSRYDFCLCLENMIMDGYMTEKMFDCLYAGTIPIYWGAPDVRTYVWPDVFIDASEFNGWGDLKDYLKSLSPKEIQQKREAGKAYVESGDMKLFYDALLHVMKPEDV